MESSMLTKQDISRMADLLDKHGYHYWAQYLRDLLHLELNSMEFIKAAGGGSVWGGAGSLMDVAMCTSPYPKEIWDRDDNEFSDLSIKLAKHLVKFEYENVHLPKSTLEIWQKYRQQ